MQEIIKKNLENLYDLLSKINVSEKKEKITLIKSEYSLLQEVEDDLEKDLENISCLDISKIVPLLYSKKDAPNVIETLRIIRVILEAKNVKKFPISLDKTQINFLNDFLLKVKQKIKEEETLINELKENLDKDLTEKDRIENQILSLEYLLEKIIDPNNFEQLTKEDFNVFYVCLNNNLSSYDEKKKALILWQQYNSNVNIKKQKVVENVNIADVKNIFQEFDLLDDVEKYLDKYAEDIVFRANLNSLREILDYLKMEDKINNKPNLLKRFEPLNLVIISIYGTLASVKKCFNELVITNRLHDIYFNTPSVWVRNIEIKSRNRILRKSTNKLHFKSSRSTLYSIAHSISFEELLENEKWLLDLGFDVSIDREKGIKTIKTPKFQLKRNFQILKMYGIIDDKNIDTFPVSTLSFSDLITKIDCAIEIGLLTPGQQKSIIMGNYIKRYPSKLQMLTSNFLKALYKLKSELSTDEYYNRILSKILPGKLDSNYIKEVANSLIKEEESFVDLSNSTLLPNYHEFENIILNNGNINYDSFILNDSLISKLEIYNHINDNDYLYVFGNLTISRLKVLRIYSILKSSRVSDLKEALLFAITYNSYVTPEDLNLILIALGINRKENGYGLS